MDAVYSEGQCESSYSVGSFFAAYFRPILLEFDAIGSIKYDYDTG